MGSTYGASRRATGMLRLRAVAAGLALAAGSLLAAGPARAGDDAEDMEAARKWVDSEFQPSAVIAVLILGIVGTGIVRAMATTLAGRVGGPRMSTTTYLIPVVAIILGVVFLDETVAPIAIVGVLVVFLGAYVASRAVQVQER